MFPNIIAELEVQRRGCQKKSDAWWSLKMLQFCSCHHKDNWIVDSQSPQFMVWQTTRKAPGPPRESSTAQGVTRRGPHTSLLGSNGHHCKVSVFVDHDHSRNKKGVVCKFTISKAVQPGLGMSSSVVLRPQVLSQYSPVSSTVRHTVVSKDHF